MIIKPIRRSKVGHRTLKSEGIIVEGGEITVSDDGGRYELTHAERCRMATELLSSDITLQTIAEHPGLIATAQTIAKIKPLNEPTSNA